MKPLHCTLVVLAAGQSTRFGRPKQLEPAGPSGESLLEYTLYDALLAGVRDVVFVLNESISAQFSDRVISRIQQKCRVSVVCQKVDDVPAESGFRGKREKPWGTGHALWSAWPVVEQDCVVVNADDFYGRDAVHKTIRFLAAPEETHTYGLTGFLLRNTLSEAGPVSRGICRIDHHMYLKSLEEKTRVLQKRNHIFAMEDGAAPQKLDPNALVSMNLWAFRNSVFKLLDEEFRKFLKNNPPDEKREFFLPSVIHSAVQAGRIRVHVGETSSRWFGMTYESELNAVRDRLLSLVRSRQYPESLWTPTGGS